MDELEEIRQRHLPKTLERDLVKVSRVLAARGVIAEPLKLPKKSWLNNKMEDDDCPQEWERWCRRWSETSTLKESTRKTHYNVLLQAGRWLARNHPEITSPQQWTRELAAEYVAAMCRLTIGEYSDKDRMSADKVGRPVKPWTKSIRINVICIFFQDCQEWEWIRASFDPRRAFRVPKSIKANLTVDPRTIEDDIWSKLLWAGLNLTTEDLPIFGGTDKDNDPFKSVLRYPLEMMRAVTMVWLFAGLRVDEIIRLPMGCIRWQREGVTVEGTAQTLPKDTVCWLGVPVNKTSAPFTKPVDRVVGEAIEAWQAVRPDQPAGVDEKAAETVHFLFAYRGMPLGSGHVNKTLIPMLCRKAGVPTEDARGNITSHRARSTIASQLANARDPMTLFEMQQWLGHKTPAATQHYVKSTPTRLAQSYSDAEYFKRNLRMIEVLVDGEAVRNGSAADGEPWKYYDLGHGYCTYDFFQQCPHRMACARCAFYVPKGSVKEQFLEGKAGLSRMREEIPLTEEETAAVEEGIELHKKMIARLSDVPTPSGKTPRQLHNQAAEGEQSTNGDELIGPDRPSSARELVPLQKKQSQS